MCAMIRVLRVCRCVRVCVLEPHISACFFLALLAAAYSYGHYYYACMDHCYACVVTMYACMRCVCAPCTYGHGTTAIAQQVCVEHFYACVGTAYIRVCVMCACCDTY